MATPRYTLTVLALALALTGCATNKPTSANAQAEIDNQILDASQKIQRSQADLYQAAALNQSTAKPSIYISDNQQRITLSWQGDALQLLNKLAHDRGLEFSFIGVRMPLPVNIDVKDARFDDVLQQLRAQIGYRADVSQFNGSLMLQYNRPQS